MSNGRIGESTAKPLKDDLRAPRFPPPPRTPSIGVSGRNASGTQPRMEPSGASLEQAPHRSGTSPVLAPEFRAEESPSFDKRLTPVVAAWPEQEASRARSAPAAQEPSGATGGPISQRPTQGPTAAMAEAEQPAPEPMPITPKPISTRPAQDLAAPQPSQRSISISLTPSGDEHAFWDGEPQYSVHPPSLVSEPPPPKPSRLRTASTRFLFLAIAGVAVGLLYYEASIAYHVPWRNPQLLMERIRLG